MDQRTANHRPPETAKAAQAFADYVALGPTRSLAKLARNYGKRSGYVRQLETWSAHHNWQQRLAQAITDRTLSLLAEAAELDAETYLAASREYRRRTDTGMVDAMRLDDLHPIRDRVKPSSPRGSLVTVNVTILDEAERLAAELGIAAADLLNEAEAIAQAAWERG